MLGILGSATQGIILLQGTQSPPCGAQCPLGGMASQPTAIDGEQVEKIVTRAAVLKRQRSVHVGFGGIEFGVAEEFAWQFGIVQAHGDNRFLTACAECV